MFTRKLAPKPLPLFVLFALIFIILSAAPRMVVCDPPEDDDSRPVDCTSGTVNGRIVDTLGFGKTHPAESNDGNILTGLAVRPGPHARLQKSGVTSNAAARV